MGNKTFIVAGLTGSGKTTLISALVKRSANFSQKAGAFKPFSHSQLMHNAEDSLTDGELFCQVMTGEPSQAFVAPYLATENYPIEMAYRRDGIRIDWAFLKERKNLLSEHYNPLFIEVPAGLLTPLCETKNNLEWIIEQDAPIIYCLTPKKEEFAFQMAEISLLKEKNLKFYLLINNLIPPRDGDYLFYLWEKIEMLSDQNIEGMLPFAKDLDLDKIAALVAEHLPSLIKEIDKP
ncbi:MAG: dethiobiotin synthase [SAR324 cluster bacterium]|nr:dethiobiotin synthase [SAR324 cluster bacterium]